MEYLTKKWGGRARTNEGLCGGEVHDDFGSWLWGEAGRHLQIGATGSFVSEQETVILIPRAAWWACSWWIGHPEVALYVDICTPAQWEIDRVTHVDLDLDVIRFVDGRVEIDDRDEFEIHQVEYGYPGEVIDGARSSADEVRSRLAQRSSF